MDFLSQTYIALRGPTGAPQSAQDTIAKLSDRLSPSTLLADRRAAVLALKGLARDCKEDVGERALPGLLEVLQNDAEIDAEIAKAVLETITQLCESDDDSKDLALKHTDYVIGNEQAVHILFSLLGDTHFYTRYATLQLLSVLLQNRRSQVQGFFLKAPAGASSVIAVLEDKREIIRNGVYSSYSISSHAWYTGRPAHTTKLDVEHNLVLAWPCSSLSSTCSRTLKLQYPTQVYQSWHKTR